jgi:hypothetical protein
MSDNWSAKKDLCDVGEFVEVNHRCPDSLDELMKAFPQTDEKTINGRSG